MKILSPIRGLNELEALVDCGVDEVYCGVLPGHWVAAYSHLASMNRVDRLNGNLQDCGELRKIVHHAHTRRVKVNLALNGLYPRAQREAVEGELDALLDTGVDGLIVADIGLLAFLKGRATRAKVHASTGATVFNSQSAAFLKELGVDRIILPRSLRKEDISALVEKNRGIEFEVFVMNGRCRNIDGFCTFQHGLSDLKASRLNRFLVSSSLGNLLQEALVKMPASLRRWAMSLAGSSVCSTACSLDYAVSVRHGERAGSGARLPKGDFLSDMYSCGGCDILEFVKWGIGAVKVVGRTFPLDRKIKDAKYLRRLIDAAQKNSRSAADFREFARGAYRDIYGRACRGNCYYPL
jgi:collagenase-like PrtC family protease